MRWLLLVAQAADGAHNMSLDQALLQELMDANARQPDPRDTRAITMEAMVESALRSAARAEECGLPHERIILSAKVSGVQDLVDVYRRLAARCDRRIELVDGRIVSDALTPQAGHTE